MRMGMERSFLFHWDFLQRDGIIFRQLHIEKDVRIDGIPSAPSHPPFHSITRLFQFLGKVLNDIFELRQGHGLLGIISQSLIDLFIGIMVQIVLPLRVAVPFPSLGSLFFLFFQEKGFEGTGKLLNTLRPP